MRPSLLPLSPPPIISSIKARDLSRPNIMLTGRAGVFTAFLGTNWPISSSKPPTPQSLIVCMQCLVFSVYLSYKHEGNDIQYSYKDNNKLKNGTQLIVYCFQLSIIFFVGVGSHLWSISFWHNKSLLRFNLSSRAAQRPEINN